jgi:3-hydroxyisobutyrate dehydrogenase-like beta-hydroxyacid dehydrogenase
MRVAVVGLGRMGTAIAERLLAAGHAVAVYNRTPGKAEALVESGALEIKDRREIWAAADLCVTMLADSAALEDVLLGSDGLAQQPAAAGKTLIDMSTVTAEASAKVAEAADEHGVQYLRAPVSGNPVAVRNGALGVIVSGDRSMFDAAEALLLDIGAKVSYVGEGERARIVKLALNLIVAGTAALLAESIALGEAHGVDRAQLLEIISGSAVGSPFVTYKSAALVADDYRSTFSTLLMRKDLEMVLSSASRAGLPSLEVTAVVRHLLDDCIAAGMGELDFMALLPHLQAQAGRDISAIVPA